MPRMLPVVLLTALTACGGEWQPPSGPRCGATSFQDEITIASVDRLDLLLVIDSAGTTPEEHAALQRKVETLMRSLLTGQPGDLDQPRLDVHVAVISAHAEYQAQPSGDATSFLSFRSPYAGLDEEAESEFIRKVIDRLPAMAPEGPRRPLAAADSFLRAATDSRNEGQPFFRLDREQGLSEIAIVIISDGDDCSGPESHGMDLLSCAQDPERLYDLERYVRWPQSLYPPAYPGLFRLVVVAGVPTEFFPLDGHHLPWGGDGSPDEVAHLYQRMLEHPEMQVGPDPHDASRPKAACAQDNVSAAPARRLVEFARRVGQSAEVQVRSLCNWDPLDIARPLTYVPNGGHPPCAPEPPRDGQGLPDCTMVWELPREGSVAAADGTPTRCEDRPYLTRDPAQPTTEDGAVRCLVRTPARSQRVGPRRPRPGRPWGLGRPGLLLRRLLCTVELLQVPLAQQDAGGLHVYPVRHTDVGGHRLAPLSQARQPGSAGGRGGMPVLTGLGARHHNAPSGRRTRGCSATTANIAAVSDRA
ncbi:MAG: hypothetical protein OXU20_09030 [Myxococcales bacterium]|nr:hypothetical protein [Myxococcales bacterium]